MKRLLVYTILLATLCTWGSCKKCTDPTNPECGNYNPCYGYPIKADFYMEEICSSNGYCSSFWKDYKTDVSVGASIRFSCINAYSSLEWHIGSGVYHQNAFTLNFSSANDGDIIPITLIIKYKPNLLCNPNDKGIDTITKTLRIDKHTFLAFGNWQGYYLDHPNDLRTISIKKQRDIFQPFDSSTYFTGIEPYLITHLDNYDKLDYQYRRGGFFQIDTSYAITGNVETDSLGLNIAIDYQYLDTPYTNTTKWIYKHFKGKKI